VLPARSGQLVHTSTCVTLCQEEFFLLFNFFTLCRADTAVSDSYDIIANHLDFVKHLFHIFTTFFIAPKPCGKWQIFPLNIRGQDTGKLNAMCNSHKRFISVFFYPQVNSSDPFFYILPCVFSADRAQRE